MSGAAGAPGSPTKAAVKLEVGTAGAGAFGGGRAPAGGRALSALALAEQALHRAKLDIERSRLVERRRRAVASFNGALEELRVERLKLEADLKATDLRSSMANRPPTLLARARGRAGSGHA